MPSDKVKIYKNPARNQTSNARQPIPQYQLLGIEPQEHKNAQFAPGQVLMTRGGVSNENNPRTRTATIRQPYAEAALSPIGNGPVPNVGNNMGHTWAGVDESIIDDLSNQIDPNHPMIDNNEMVSPIEEPLMEIQDNEPIQMLEQQSKPFWTAEDLQSAISKSFEDNPVGLSNLQDNSYILLIRGDIISIGSLQEIEEEANVLLFGDHELCNGKPLPLEDIVVLKKVKIKTGLFLE